MFHVEHRKTGEIARYLTLALIEPPVCLDSAELAA